MVLLTSDTGQPYVLTVPGGQPAVPLPLPQPIASCSEAAATFLPGGGRSVEVVLREGDLGYVHVHPEPQLSNGAVKFWLSAPSPGTYRMYFDFSVGGKVSTAEFTLKVA